MLCQANFISRETRLFDHEKAIGSNSSDYYAEYPKIGKIDKDFIPIEFIDFMEDLKKIEANDIVLVCCSGASGRADFIVEYGNPIGEKEVKTNSTITNSELATTFESILLKNLSEVQIRSKKANEEPFKFIVENHTIGNDDPKWIGKAIHRLTGAQVITLYINIDILTGTNKKYYAALRELINSVKEFKSQVV
jgi:hypothetical protein